MPGSGGAKSKKAPSSPYTPVKDGGSHTRRDDVLYVGDEKTYQAGIYATIDARTLRRARRHLPQLSTAVGTLPAQGWYPDPAQRFYRRWWDGHSWTDHVFNDKHTLIDPLG